MTIPTASVIDTASFVHRHPPVIARLRAG